MTSGGRPSGGTARRSLPGNKKISAFRHSVRGRILMIFLLFSLASGIMLGGFCYLNVYYQMLDSTVAYSETIARQISRNAGMILDETEKIMMIGNGSSVSAFLYDQGNRHETTMELIEMVKFYRESCVFDDDIRNFYILGTDGICFDEKKGLYHIDRYEKSRYIYDLILENENELLVLSGQEMGWENEECFLVGRKIRQIWTNKTIGIMAIELDAHAVQSIYRQEVLGDSGYFTLYDKDGVELFAGEEEKAKLLRQEVFENPEGSYQEKTDNGTELVVYDSIANTGWIIVGRVPLRELMEPTYKLGAVFFGVLLLTLIFLAVLYYYLSKWLIAPIMELKDKMLLAEQGDLDAMAKIAGDDEISVLQNRYNQMLSHIKVLMEENIKEQRNLQKAEMRALQAQINPHFLYNTLELVIWLAASEENDQVIEVVDKLAVFFKTGLSKGMEWIPVKKEVEHVESYLAIQGRRYSDLLSYEIRIDPDVYQCFMLKMILQPIVENAIYHGIKNKEDGGKITISGRLQGEFLVFEVVDTGCGMEEAVLEGLKRKIRENVLTYSEHENGFGFYNVNRRIRLYYGEDCGLEIWSRKEEGTRVTIRLKRQTEGNSHV